MRTIFWLLDNLPKITNTTNSERCILFKGVWHTLNKKTKKTKMVFSLRDVVVVRDHFLTLRYPSENNLLDKCWKVHTFQRGLTYFKQKNKKIKSGVFSIGQGCRQLTIFWLLGILTKITDWTNGERCMLFKGVWCTLNKKIKK